ncbi:MAG: TIGR00159 family protein [Aphanocapsa feldmannii 277cV]|uniref:Diadenylate cyclase n=1 Tax=Aphanocapsa feldmannii 277cV TaxID=2507553 RepID=A0A524RQF8_9CHRO|nr:MAG: TIGR00159 family protein [Aphanocapsa feldmannii 288cV]TGG94704.1 MAG: TIGR00159 family protein [Aphanocapsa feldmannii 277cV]
MLWFGSVALDVSLALLLGLLLKGRVTDRHTFWLLRGYLLLVAAALVARQSSLSITGQLLEAMVLVCGLALAALLQGELRRLLELLGTGRLDLLFGNRSPTFRDAGTVPILSEAAGRMSQNRRGALIVLDIGADLRPEDFFSAGIEIDAVLSVDLLLNLFAADTPLHDGAVVLRSGRVIAAAVILPLSRQRGKRYGTRHLAALGITERFDKCLCVVVSEETGTISLARQGRLERPITSTRLTDLLAEAMADQSNERRRRQPWKLQSGRTQTGDRGAAAEATAP